jgi:UDP-4-amino-4,6-dideoxy-N-acetyl-beta-L-altrosamine N-acetyltransferase
MKISKYDFIVSPLREENIEMVRHWRNDPVVASNHAFREYITPEMQKAWFKSIDTIHTLYGTIDYKDRKIGVINMKNIDWETRTAEGGIFIPDTQFHNTPVPAIASFLAVEIAFEMFDLSLLSSHVLKENRSVQSFVRSQGYVLSPGQDDIENQEYILTREKFEGTALRIRKAIRTLAGDDRPGCVAIEPADFDNEVLLFFEKWIKNNGTFTKTETTPGGRFYYFT